MERPRQLFRDYGLTLALLLAAVLIYRTTTLPAIRLNEQRDRSHLELLDRQQQQQDEIDRLDAKASAITDPIELEREHRRKFGTLGLPADELPVRDDDESDAAPAPRAPSAAAPRPGG